MGRQHNAANDICSAGSHPLWERRCCTPPSTWLHLLITMCQSREAKRIRTGSGCSQALVLAPRRDKKAPEACEIPCCCHNAWHWKKITLLLLPLQNLIFWASSCKTDAKCYHLLMTVQDAKKWQKCLHGQAVSTPPKGRHTVVAYKGNHAAGPLSRRVLSVVQTTIFRSEIFRHSLAP